MNIKNVNDAAFLPYGFVVEGYDFTALLHTLCTTTEMPADSVLYVPCDDAMERLLIFLQLRDGIYGGMPIQIGYCNGSNHKLNCLEYHRGSEVNVGAEDSILLLSSLQKIRNQTIDTSEVEAFVLPAGTAVVLYETTLHYAPCNAEGKAGFRVIIVLPKGTNTEKPDLTIQNEEDRILWARNKWLLAHAEAPEAAQGAVVGLLGNNITI